TFARPSRFGQGRAGRGKADAQPAFGVSTKFDRFGTSAADHKLTSHASCAPGEPIKVGNARAPRSRLSNPRATGSPTHARIPEYRIPRSRPLRAFFNIALQTSLCGHF